METLCHGGVVMCGLKEALAGGTHAPRAGGGSISPWGRDEVIIGPIITNTPGGVHF